ncbi:MAG: CsgG/HfaB family protein [Verrucomicrobiota bacterium]
MKKHALLQLSLAAVAGMVCFTFSGCFTTSDNRPVTPGAIPFKKGCEVPPVVAVMEFENQGGGNSQWNLGSSMADMLVTRLMDTKKVVVLERQNIRDILGELALQKQGVSRQEGRVAGGRLKNAKYLIRGAITDFSGGEGLSGGVGVSSYKIFGGGSRSQVGLHMRIYDVETGEIIGSAKGQGHSASGSAGAAGQYKNIKFGGEAFMRTPLGKATERAMTEAIEELFKVLPVDYWHPLVAESDQGAVIVNGGENVSLKPGDQFLVREKPRFVTDPATGNVIDTITGNQTGRIRVEKVGKLSATAKLVEGTAVRGQLLELMK